MTAIVFLGGLSLVTLCQFFGELPHPLVFLRFSIFESAIDPHEPAL